MSATGHRGPPDIIPRTRAKIDLKYVAGRKKFEDSEKMKSHIQELLNQSLDDSIFEITMWIETKVAMLTGDLRKSLIKFLNRSKPPPQPTPRLEGIRLVLGVGSDITYAKYVNKFTTSNVRHSIDPRAIGFYHDKMVIFGKERFMTNVDKARYKFQMGG